MTRAASQAARLGALLRSKGATPVFLPTIAVGPPEDAAPLREATSQIDAYDLIVLGSLNAATALATALSDQGLRCAAPIACVGAKTRQALVSQPQLRSILQGELLSPTVYRAEALVQEIQLRWAERGGMTGLKVLHPRAPEGREIVQDRLTDFGAEVHAVEAYRIVPAGAPNAETLGLACGAEVVTFLSGQTLEAWLKVVPEPLARQILERAVVGVIGPVAAEHAQRLGVRVDVVPEEATAEALVEALDRHLLKA